MEIIRIKTEEFFELLRLKDTSMWDVFSQMVSGEEKQILFVDKEDNIMFNYILPSTQEQLEADKQAFNQSFMEKLRQN